MMHAVDAYVAVRRAAGFALTNAECLLRSFARCAGTRGETHVHTATPMQWATQASSIAQRDERLKTVRRFALHVHAEDQRHDIPPRNVFGHRKTRRLPFIYTQTDIQRLLQVASRLGPPGTLRPYAYTTLFALLAATGLRISEALALRLDDVTQDGLLIRKTKFRKDRLVPLHETARAGLESYLRLRQREAPNNPHVFVSRGRPLLRLTVYSTFRTLLRRSRLRVSRGGNVLGFMTCGTPSRRGRWRRPHSNGITSAATCSRCRPIWDTAMSARPTGTSKPLPS